MTGTSSQVREVRQEGLLPAPAHQCPVRRILVCLDRSKVAERSIPSAVAIARASAARVTLLHVLEVEEEPGTAHPVDPVEWKIQRQEALDYLQSVSAQMVDSEIDIDTVLLEGHGAEQILGHMGTKGIDLTVLTRHGRHGVTQWTLSSTAHKILARARGSVLVVPASPCHGYDWQSPPRRVLVPLDGSVRAECALGLAESIAERFEAELIVMHVVSEPDAGAGFLLDGEDPALTRELADRWQRAARRYTARILARARASHTASREVIEGRADVRQGLIEAVQRERADLVVMSAHGHTCNTDRPFGSVAEHLVSYCDRPLLLVQDLQHGEFPPEPAERGVAPLAADRPDLPTP